MPGFYPISCLVSRSLSVLAFHEDKREGHILVQLIIGQLRLCHIQLTQKSFVRMRK